MSKPTPFDPGGALRLLTENGVEFVLIGGLAARLHGSPTFTDDLDICHSTAADNLERLARALTAMDARLRGAPPDVPFILDAKSLAAGANFTFSTEFGPLDCLALPSGVGGYDDLVANAVGMDLATARVSVASVDDLIRMKRAAARPKDRVELEILGAVRAEAEDRAAGSEP
jgi:hypothetical protein